MGLLKVFKMVVAYDGTRYHGFQRQIDNATMMKMIQIMRKQQDSSSKKNTKEQPAGKEEEDEDETSKFFALERPTKRPKYELDGSRKKHSKLSIQQILEMVCMYLVSTTTTTAIEKNHDDDMFSVDDLCLKFAGRTDRGVHARGQVVTVQLPKLSPFQWNSLVQNDNDETLNGDRNDHIMEKENDDDDKGNADCFWLCKSINSRLPLDVSVHDVKCLGTAPIAFDPRRHVRKKRYTYTIKYRRRNLASSSNDCLPELGPYAIRHALDSPVLWVCPWSLDDFRITALCERIRGTHDYRNFVHKHVREQTDHTLTIDRIDYEIVDVKTEIHRYPIRMQSDNDSTTNSSNIDQAEFECTNIETVTGRFIFEATGFRRTMLRNIVGYCVEYCRARDDDDGDAARKEDEDPFGDDMAGKIHAAPASGLCLESVTY